MAAYSLRAKHNRALEAGWVYTPFVRVALAASRAKKAGAPLRPDRISSSLTAPIIYIAMAQLELPAARKLDVLETAPAYIEIGEHPEAEGRILPLWVSRDFGRLPDLRTDLTVRNVEIVAAFELEAVRSRRDILCYRTTLTEGSRGPGHRVTGLMRASITETEWSRWR